MLKAVHIRPRAGDLRQEQQCEILYIAPRPIPTGVAPFSVYQVRRVANDVYLDFGLDAGGAEFVVRWYIGWLMGPIILFAVSGLGIGLSDYIKNGVPTYETFSIVFFKNWLMWGITGLFGSIFAYLFYRRFTSSLPPRPYDSTVNAAKSLTSLSEGAYPG